MTPENFVNWLDGYFELSNAKGLNAAQIEKIKEKINLALGREQKTEKSKPAFVPAFYGSAMECISGQMPRSMHISG